MKKAIYLLILLVTAFNGVKADPQSDISKANQAYKAGFYDNASALYEKVISEGLASADLYYNLGNAYFKAGNFPSAILNYERALKLDPSNEDIAYNLKVANNQIIDKIDQLPRLFYMKWWDSLRQLFSPDGWSYLTITLFSLFFILLTAFLLSSSIKVRRILLPVSFVFLILTGLSFILSYQTYKNVKEHKEAIVFAPVLPVKSSPEDSGIDLFVIHEGLKVQIMDELTGWKEIKITNGSKGWVKAETITQI